MSSRVLHSSRPTSLARPPPTRPLPRAPVLLDMHALPAKFTTTLDFATFAADCAAYAPLLWTPTSSMAYSLIMMRIDAEEENSGAGEGALYAEADVVAEVRSVCTNSPRSWCLRRPYHPACRTSSTCKHWLWTRTAGTREDMGPRLPEAALPTCKAHGGLGEQALSPVAFTQHTVSSSNATLHAEECEPALCSRLSSTLSSVQSTSLYSHFYTVSRIRTPPNQKDLRLPLRPDAPTPLPPRARANPPSTNGQREGPPTAPRRAKRRPLIPERERRAGRGRRRARARRTRLRIRVRRPLGGVIRRIAARPHLHLHGHDPRLPDHRHAPRCHSCVRLGGTGGARVAARASAAAVVVLVATVLVRLSPCAACCTTIAHATAAPAMIERRTRFAPDLHRKI
ncbi:hypothetical protein DFH08DRAFT_978104 [Mycena albidolilacea]|uniref:Uncharacterized protein n=1 Tax=Mycena albidolilacea TaxID=1033008 RepID=A0AAD6Z026_9AGAR|nr:hypothetical protein DFH08DRAFT_978104 [Mycena albidolilacea]